MLFQPTVHTYIQLYTQNKRKDLGSMLFLFAVIVFVVGSNSTSAFCQQAKLSLVHTILKITTIR